MIENEVGDGGGEALHLRGLPAAEPATAAESLQVDEPGGTSINVRILLWTAAGVVVAALVGLISVLPHTDSGPTLSVTQSGSADNGGTVINNNGYLEFQQQVPPGASDGEVRKAAADYADTPPPAGSPAPFRVVGAQEHGVKVRSTPDVNGTQIGSAANGTTLWVDCAATTTFDPDLTDTIGPRWLRVHWPTATPGTAFGNSAPNAADHGWVYAGLTVPAGHNGQVPSC